MAHRGGYTQWSHATLETLRAELDHFARQRDWEQFHTPRNLLFALQGEVGELAEIFQWKGEVAPGLLGFSDSDRQQVAEELSDVLTYTIRMADRCGIDLAAAVHAKIEKNSRKYPPALCHGSAAKYTEYSAAVASAETSQNTNVTAPARRYQPLNTPEPFAAAPPGIAVTPPGEQPPPLPVSATGPSLPPPAVGVGSAAAAPAPARGGRGQPHLDAETLRQHEKQSGGGGVQAKRPTFKRTLSVATGNVMVGPPAPDMYSPTHFQHNLFSPATKTTDFNIEYNTNRPVLPKSLSKKNVAVSWTAGAEAPPASSAVSSPLTPNSMRSFFPIVEQLQTLQFNEQEFANLDLTFCAPNEHGKMVDLIPNGRNIAVTLQTKDDFIRCVNSFRSKQRAPAAPHQAPRPAGGPAPPAAGAASPPAAQPRRPASGPGPGRLSRNLTIQLPKQNWDADRERAQFSPTHFDHGLFSPNTQQTDFVISYSSPQRCLPQSLSKKDLTPPANGHGVSEPPRPSLSSPPAVEKGPPPELYEDAADRPKLAGSRSSTQIVREAGYQLSSGHVSPRAPGKKISPVSAASRRRQSIASGSEDGDEEGEFRGLDLLCEVADELQEARKAREEEQRRIEEQRKHMPTTTSDGVPLSPRTLEMEENFGPMIEQLELMCSPGAEQMDDSDLEEMGLTWCMPFAGQVHDLIPNGQATLVRAFQLAEFIRLAKAKHRELGGVCN